MQIGILFRKNPIGKNQKDCLLIGLLAIFFIISFSLRSQVADYGFVLNETDPFYNFRATEFLVTNGFDSYSNWHDTKSWYPEGRDVFETSQVVLHITAAILYKIFGFGTSLQTFVIFFPAIIGSLTSIIVFALVRTIAGTTSGLFSGLFFSVSPLFILRGNLGWFKSEPLGFFYSLLAIYLFFSALKNPNKKTGILKSLLAGFFLGISFSAWGGSQFFIIPIGLFIISIPFFRKEHDVLVWTTLPFVAMAVIFSSILSRSGEGFITELGGLGLIGPAIFLVILITIQKFSNKHSLRNSLSFLIASISSGIIIITSGFFSMPASVRYPAALNPFIEGGSLFESIAEHATPTLEQSFASMSVLIPLAGLGIWFVFENKKNSSLKISHNTEFLVFLLILGILGVYVGSILLRLMVFSSLVVIIFSGIGLSVLTSEIFKSKTKKVSSKERNLVYSSLMVLLLLAPLGFFPNINWINITDNPPTILNGNSNFKISTQDWILANNWIKENTPKESIIAAWWDWGYWITTLSERTTLADNAALPRPSIPKLAKMFLSNQDDGYMILRDLKADYVVISVVGERKVIDGREVYYLKKGGDDGKLNSMIKISGEDPNKFFNQNMIPNKNFWQNTVLGKLLPFSPSPAEFFDGNKNKQDYSIFYEKIVKFDDEDNVPFKLVYSSPGLSQEKGIFVGVLVYEINKDYIPKN